MIHLARFCWFPNCRNSAWFQQLEVTIPGAIEFRVDETCISDKMMHRTH